MRLYIAEKPSLARAIAEVMPTPHKKADGYIQTADGNIVSWCIGHLLEQAPPDAYAAHLKKWQLHDLPIIPDKWLLLPKSSTKKQLTILMKLIHKADNIIHVGDPDREGQLLIDEILNYSHLSIEKIRQVKRCLISDLNPESVKKALTSLKSNNDFIALSTSALARARADWLYGINMSRLYTLKGRHLGHTGVLSVGRVQTPLLGLVVSRDIAIEQFVATPFYEVHAVLKTENSNETFQAKWQPSESCSPYQDEEGRIIVKALAENVVSRIVNKFGEVCAVTKKRKTIPPPLPLNLSTLQIEMAKKTNMSAKAVLDHCQCLYEKYKLITYPRSDSRYLPEEHLKHIDLVKAAIGHNVPEFTTILKNADYHLRSTAWNDKKVEAHHAIIPTVKKISHTTLSAPEQAIYQMIVRYYLAQFYPVYRYTDLQIDIALAGGVFIARKLQTLAEGWKQLFNKINNDADEGSQQLFLAKIKAGDKVKCIDALLQDKKTQAPKPFNDATLLSAMTGIARFVKDPEIRKILRETDGLGTEATRASIIELLFKRQFLQREGKKIKATTTGRQLIANLPSIATTPDLTALWESGLDAICKKEQSYTVFMTALDAFLHKLIGDLKTQSFHN